MLEEIATFFNDSGVGSYTPAATTGNIFLNTIPEGSEKIGIYSVPGLASDSKNFSYSPGIQVLYRGTLDPIASYDVSRSIYRLMHNFERGYFVVGGKYIVSSLSQNSEPVYIGVSGNKEFEFINEFIVEYRD